MRLCVLSESPADAAAIRILVEGLRGKPTEPVPALPLRGRGGVHVVLAIMEALIRHLHYNTEADALAVAVDSDHEPVHVADHDHAPDPDCRFCIMRRTLTRVRARLQPRVNQPPVKIAVGLAVPAIEAWYLLGQDQRVGEDAWNRCLGTPRLPYTKIDLKHQVYKTDHPLLAHETHCAGAAARRLVQNLAALEGAFPGGFGPFAREVRTW